MITRVFDGFNRFFMDFDGDFVDYLRVYDDFMGFFSGDLMVIWWWLNGILVVI